MDKNRSTSRLTNVVVVDASNNVTLPALLTLGSAPLTADNSGKVPTTAWIRAQNFLTANQTITVSGDATGSGGTSIALTLANTGITAGSYKIVTVDAKGRVTAGSNPTTLAGFGITDAQPLDADLTAIAALAATSGFLKKTAANTWALDNSTYLTGINSSQVTTALGFTPENSANRGNANGYASLDSTGKVPSAQLPPYVDDVLDYVNLAGFPGTGETGKIYIATDTNKIYRWTGAVYTEVSAPNAGTVTSVAFTSGNGMTTSGGPITSSGTITIGATTDNLRINSLGVGMAASTTAGRIDASNDIVGFSTSDIRLKKDISVIENASKLLSQLRGVSYVWDEQSKAIHGYSGKDYGIIAQDVEKVFPEMIQHRDNGYMAVRYERLIGVLVAALNEQNLRIEQLEARLS